MYKWNGKEIDINQINLKWNIPEYKLTDGGKVLKLLKFHPSWYPDQYLNEIEYKWIISISKVFKIMNADKEWIDYLPANHQIEWHKYDNVCLDWQGLPPIHRIVIKSRNTSFTVSSSISSILSGSEYHPNIIPVVRLNSERAVDLIRERKELALHITPIDLGKNGLWPYDPTKVDISKETVIKFPSGSRMRAFPAYAASADAIRGERNNASADLDEVNFMSRFTSIFTAAKDAKSGIGKKGYSTLQLNVGTTLKGKETNFALWLENIYKIMDSLIKEGKDPIKELGMKIFDWPIFERDKFNPEISIFEQPDLTVLVPWQSLVELEKDRRGDLPKFLEEYMAIQVDKEDQLYPYELIESAIDEKLTNHIVPYKTNNPLIMGVDVAGGEGGDFFSISIFEEIQEKDVDIILDENGNEIINNVMASHYYQRHLFLERNTPLPLMEKKIEGYLKTWNIEICRIDKGGNGAQISQYLAKTFPGKVEAVDSKNRVNIGEVKEGGRKKQLSVPVKEYIHTQQKYLMHKGRYHLLDNELQSRHFAMWDGKFEAPRTRELGHGDSTISNGYCVIPKSFKSQSNSLAIGGTIKGKTYIQATQNPINHEIEDGSIVSGFRPKMKRIGIKKMY